MSGITLENRGESLSIRVPMKMKKRGGRKEIVAPESLAGPIGPSRRPYQEALVIAMARGHRWQELLESGEYSSITEMAEAFGLCSSYTSRLMRFALLAPDIIEAILAGNEPSGFSIHKLLGAIPAGWEKQREKYGFRIA